MLTDIAKAMARSPRRVLITGAILASLAALAGPAALSHLSSGGFVNPSAPSSMASYTLEKDFKLNYALTVVVHSDSGVNDGAARQVGIRLVTLLRSVPDAYGVTSYWTEPSKLGQTLIGADGQDALINIELSGSLAQQEASALRIESLARRADRRANVAVKVGGEVPTIFDVTNQAKADLAKALILSIPVLALLLLLVFGSVAAGLIPMGMCAISLAGGLAALRGIELVLPVSIFAANMASGIALALAIDYSLLLISRYREEILSGSSPAEAIIRTVQTAGRTVLFSAVALSLCMSALLVFPVYGITSIAYAGIAVAVVSATTAILLVPAALTILGDRIDRGNIRLLLRKALRRSPSASPSQLEQTFWFRAAATVMRHPVALGLVTTEFLLLLGSPFLAARFGPPDDRVLPPSSQVRQVGDTMRSQFQVLGNQVIVVMPDRAGVGNAQLEHYARSLSNMPRVIYVLAATGQYQSGSKVEASVPGLAMAAHGATYLEIAADGSSYGPAGAQVMSEIDRVKAPAPVLLGGATPAEADMMSAIQSRLPLAVVILVVSMFVVLFLFTGSLLLPVKAILASAMSLCAAFGALVWIFQDGHLLGYLFHEVALGFLVPQTLTLIFVISFGISIDYEVFLLARIREEWLKSDQTASDNTYAVQVGLARAARIISPAALIMAIVFATMTSASLSIIQMFGVGLSLAVVIDASVIRGILVPAFMRLTGRANWWLPPWLLNWHHKLTP